MGGTLYIQGQQTGVPDGSPTIGPFTLTLGTARDIIPVVLSGAFQSITIPSTITPDAILIIPPSGYTGTYTIKGVTGDTGIVGVSGTSVCLIPLSAAPAALGIISSAAYATAPLIVLVL